MHHYTIRSVTKNDMEDITRIYNSNHAFLKNHLGATFIDTAFCYKIYIF